MRQGGGTEGSASPRCDFRYGAQLGFGLIDLDRDDGRGCFDFDLECLAVKEDRAPITLLKPERDTGLELGCVEIGVILEA